MKKSEIIVHLHIGRGGRYYNAGHVSFVGENGMQNVIDRYLYLQNRDKNGKFCKPFYTDETGNFVSLTLEEAKQGVGTIDFDGHFDTHKFILATDLDENEAKIVIESKNYKSNDLCEFLEENFPQLFETENQ